MFGGGDRRRTADSGRLQAVLVKLAGVMPQHLGEKKRVTSSKDIIESVLAETAPIPAAAAATATAQNWNYDLYPSIEDTENSAIVHELAKRLEDELRAAKRTHLSCTEVLLPCGLLQRIARDILAMAECEPCGLRGCTLYLCYESEDCNKGTPCTKFKCDPTTASTFELYLTLRLAARGWNYFLPQFLRNLTKGGTVIVSSAYTLNKKKLYRSYIE